MNTFTKTIIATSLIMAAAGTAIAADQQIPWGTGSGDTESHHIARVGEDLNSQHQLITPTTVEGAWAAGTGSISQDEKALNSSKPKVITDKNIHFG